MAKREPKFKRGNILQVAWNSSHGSRICDFIRIDAVVEHSDAIYSMFYVFSHLSGTTKGRNNDMRCLATVEDLLKAQLAPRAARILYEV